MKTHLIDSLKYNDWANQKLLPFIKQLSNKEESITLFSHLINAQDKWYNRISKQKDDLLFSWSSPVFPLEELEERWENSISVWINLIKSNPESELQENVIFTRASDGKQMGIKLVDLVLQLNYHSIHHRAQINKLMSQQGITPPSTDYVFTKLIEL